MCWQMEQRDLRTFWSNHTFSDEEVRPRERAHMSALAVSEWQGRGAHAVSTVESCSLMIKVCDFGQATFSKPPLCHQ